MDYYHRMSDVYRVAAIDRELYKTVDGGAALIAREQIMIPVIDTESLFGASVLLATLAFPDDPKKRKEFVACSMAKLVKLNFAQNSQERKNCQHLTLITNKKIEQFLGFGKKSAGYRINMRMRAADVLWMKLQSSPNPAQQVGLRKIAEQVASCNSANFAAFFSDPRAGGDPVDSFIKRIMWPSKPVIHVAMALHFKLRELDLNGESTFGLIMVAEKWLVETLFLAEIIRVEFGCIFPRHDSQYLNNRVRNFSVDLEQTIVFLPIIDKLGK